MIELNKAYGNYNKYPEKVISTYDHDLAYGYTEICNRLKKCKKNRGMTLVAVDCYPGTDIEELLEGLSGLNAELTIKSDEAFLPDDEYCRIIRDNLTDDPVFGIMTCRRLEHFLSSEGVERVHNRINAVKEGLVLVIGVGAALVCEPDVLIYADLARWEIQTRMKQGMCNWKTENSKAPFLEKFKQGYFLEWRLADRHKKTLFDSMDFFLDTNQPGKPKMISGDSFRSVLKKFASEPFRLVPYFDPGVWGGQWMKEVCGLDEDKPNYAWSFDGVPEENSLYARFGSRCIEFPAIDVVLYQPRALLGERVHARFGTEFPIRFDLLDTMSGGNLSLQVHPLTEYIQETFGMHYTQDESYYILDAEKDACVFLGLKENIKPEEMIKDLYRAQQGADDFSAEKYINRFPAKKHDHFLIPAGTVHCSGAGAMVLEISATPYIFTFKLWDWGRVGLDGKPRPIHIGHGEKNIIWERTTPWVEKNLINCLTDFQEQEGVKAERTGLHEREFVETMRHSSAKPVIHDTMGSVNVLNLVDGAEAVVESEDGRFEPFVVHYAETFIIPESVKSYTIRPYGRSEGQEITTIKAYVKN